MIVVDAHSKWPEVLEMSSITAGKTIKVMRLLFATHRIPEQVVSDNRPPCIQVRGVQDSYEDQWNQAPV